MSFEPVVFMRVINDLCLPNMVSPIRHVMAYLPNALVNIAPERTKEFALLHPEFTLEYCDVPTWICKVDTQKNLISLSRRVVEVVWCACYAYMVFYIKKVQNNQFGSTKEINLAGYPLDASCLYR
jgi:hypothetical protein